MLTLENVCKHFGDRSLFTNISCSFEPGKIYSLIGASGCGKTTLLNMMAKLETYEGSIFFRDKELNRYKSTTFFRNELGYLFQNLGLIENQTIEENLNLGLIGKKLKKQVRRKREMEALAQVGLSYLNLNQKIFELSGGESQRVALAKVILKDPPLIFADEPTASVDPETAISIMDILLSLKNENRIIIIATHNPLIWERVDEVIEVEKL